MISLGTLREATRTAAVTQFLEESVLVGTDWNLQTIKRRGTRLEPPHAYWVNYRITVGRGEATEVPSDEPAQEEESPADQVAPPTVTWSEQRELRLVARGVFDPAQWQAFAARLRSAYRELPCSPLDGLGYPVIFDERQLAFWFYPVDIALPGLRVAADRAEMLRILRNMKQRIVVPGARIADVEVDTVKYIPEITSILRYDVKTDPADAQRTLYGKVQAGDRSRASYELMQSIHAAAAKSGGRLTVAEPVAHLPELGMALQSAVAGVAVGGDRTDPAFLPAALAAAEALAVIHDSGLPTHHELTLDREMARYERVLDQFAMTHPRGYFLLRDLLSHLRDRIRKARAEEKLPTHGDFKYDQVLHHEGTFSIIDFDFFGTAETSFDIGKFCAHLVPSMPKSWEQSVAAEEARTAFLDRYRVLRPGATLQRFPIYEAVNLAGRAMTLMWSQLRDWQPASESLLVLAMERLNTRLQ